MDKKLSIINKFKKENYSSYPFPFFTIEKPFDNEIYSKLERDYNLFISFFKKHEEYKKIIYDYKFQQLIFLIIKYLKRGYGMILFCIIPLKIFF